MTGNVSDEGTWFSAKKIISHMRAKEQRTETPEEDIKQLADEGFDPDELIRAGDIWAGELFDEDKLGESAEAIICLVSSAFTMGLEAGVNLERQRLLEESVYCE